MVVVEQLALALVHVQREPGQPLLLERRDHRPRVHEPAARRVDQQRPRLHERQRRVRDDVPRLVRQRAVQRHHVAAPQQLLERHVLAERLERGARERVVRHQLAPEALHDPRERNPDAPRADQPHRLAGQRAAQQPVEREVALAHAVVRAVRAPIQSLDQRHRVLGYGLGRVRRHVGHGEPQVLRRHQVDVVVARAAEEDRADPRGAERLEDGRRQHVVDEDAHGVRVAHEVGGLGREGDIVEGEG